MLVSFEATFAGDVGEAGRPQQIDVTHALGQLRISSTIGTVPVLVRANQVAVDVQGIASLSTRPGN